MSPTERASAGGRAVVVHPDAEVLAQAVAARLLTRLLDVQSVRRPAHMVVTGGTIGIAILAAVGGSPLRGVVDWSGVHVWWGDERFLPAGDPDRNETQARAALLDALGDALPAENVHPMPGSDAPGIASAEDSAAEYAVELAGFAADGAAPAFDVLLLGVGPDGHVASLFPGHVALTVTGVCAVGVHGSPKPPPDRVSLTFDAINGSREIWLVASGTSKASAVAAALGGAPMREVPAAGAAATRLTLWLLDADAAAASQP